MNNIVEAIAAKEEARQLGAVAATGFGHPAAPAQFRTQLEAFEHEHGASFPTHPHSAKSVTRSGAYWQSDSTGVLGAQFFPPPSQALDRLMNQLLWRKVKLGFARDALALLNVEKQQFGPADLSRVFIQRMEWRVRELGPRPLTVGPSAPEPKMYFKHVLAHLRSLVNLRFTACNRIVAEIAALDGRLDLTAPVFRY
jgi:hypothetical protein